MSTGATLLLMGSVLVVGFYAGKLVRKVRLPSLIGYMVLGVALGPTLSHLIQFSFFDDALLEALGFVTDICLGLVAFNIGAELSLASLRRLGPGIVSVIFAESFGAFLATSAAIYGFTAAMGHPDLPLALIFGSMAPASAPAGTVAVIQEYRTKGPLTKALYAVVGFDDGLAIVIFGFALAVVKTLLAHEVGGGSAGFLASMAPPALEILESVGVGTVMGFLYCQIVRHLKQPSETFIMTLGFVFAATGLSILLHLSLIMTNLVIGFVLVNTRREELSHRVQAPLLEIMPMLFILFFCLAGAHLDIAKLPSLGLLGLVYIAGRSGGLIGGARLGATLGGVEDVIKKYVGFGILSQAGVAIGLSLIVSREFAGLSNPRAADIGSQVLTSITATCIIFEIVGPICTKFALHWAGEIPEDRASGP